MTLEERVAKLEKMLLTVMTGPFKTMKETLANVQPMLEEYQNKTGAFAPPETKKKHTRKPMNWVDWSRVQSELDGDSAESYRTISKSLNLPETTVRKYAKMPPDEVAKLEADHLAQQATNGEDGDE